MGTRRFFQSLIADATHQLRAIEAGNPPLEAEHLMTAALGTDRKGFLGLGDDDPLEPAVLDRFEALLTRRLTREPLQYVLGSVPFCELELEVGPGVLIPRSETEILVEKVSAWFRRSPIGAESPARSPRSPWMIDVGTGSGAILLALLNRFPGWNGLGIDLSREALAYARRNREAALGSSDPTLGDRAHFALGNGLESVGSIVQRSGAPATGSARSGGPETGSVWSGRSEARSVRSGGPGGPEVGSARSGQSEAGSVMVIVSNPPYIPSTDIPLLAPEIRDHEPRLALDGGADGLDVVRPLIVEAADLLVPGGLLALELSYDQPDRVAETIRSDARFGSVETFQDLAGRSRGILAGRC